MGSIVVELYSNHAPKVSVNGIAVLLIMTNN
jgi:hypothetical protein